MDGNGNFRVIQPLDIGQNHHGAEIGGQGFQAVLDRMFEFSLVQAFFGGGVWVSSQLGDSISSPSAVSGSSGVVGRRFLRRNSS